MIFKLMGISWNIYIYINHWLNVWIFPWIFPWKMGLYNQWLIYIYIYKYTGSSYVVYICVWYTVNDGEYVVNLWLLIVNLEYALNMVDIPIKNGINRWLIYNYILVGGWALPLWKMMELVSWDDFSIPNRWKVKKTFSSHHQPGKSLVFFKWGLVGKTMGKKKRNWDHPIRFR